MLMLICCSYFRIFRAVCTLPIFVWDNIYLYSNNFTLMTHLFVWVALGVLQGWQLFRAQWPLALSPQPVPNITPMMTHHGDNFIAMNVCKLKTRVLSSSAKTGRPIECTGSVPRPVTRLGCLAGDWRLQSADDGIMTGGDTADTKR